MNMKSCSKEEEEDHLHLECDVRVGRRLLEE